MKQLFILIPCIICGMAISAQNQIVFDSTFGDFGEALFIPGSWEGKGLLLQPDGKIVVYGNDTDDPINEHNDIRLSRINPNGTLDATFNQTGNVFTGVAYDRNFSVTGGQLQPDGKILIVGKGEPTDGGLSSPLLARYNPNGTIDSLFGINGLAIQNLDTLYTYSAYCILLDDAKILVICTAANLDSYTPILYRLNSNGQIDSTFGVNGFLKIANEIILYPEALKRAIDGTIYILGRDGSNVGESSSVIAKINPDGMMLDLWPISTDLTIMNEVPYFSTLTIQPDGKILAGGSSYPSAMLIRLTPDGDIDSTFSHDGIIKESFGDNFGFINDVIVQPDNKVLIYLGSYYSLGRINPNGSMDYSFNGSGLITVPHIANGDPINNVGGSFGTVVQTDGKILVGATIEGQLYVARYKNKPCTVE